MVQARLESCAFVSPNALGAGSRTPAMTRHGRKAIGCVVASIDVPSLAELVSKPTGAGWVYRRRLAYGAAPIGLFRCADRVCMRRLTYFRPIGSQPATIVNVFSRRNLLKSVKAHRPRRPGCLVAPGL